MENVEFELDKPTHIYVEPLHKGFTVEHTTENVLKAVNYKLLGLESDDPDLDPNSLEGTKKQIELFKANVDLIVDILGLDDEDKQKLSKLPLADLSIVDAQVMSAAQGAKTEDVKKMVKKVKAQYKSAAEQEEKEREAGKHQTGNNKD